MISFCLVVMYVFVNVFICYDAREESLILFGYKHHEIKCFKTADQKCNQENNDRVFVFTDGTVFILTCMFVVSTFRSSLYFWFCIVNQCVSTVQYVHIYTYIIHCHYMKYVILCMYISGAVLFRAER